MSFSAVNDSATAHRVQMTVDHLSNVLFDVSRQGYIAWREAAIPAAIALVAFVVALATRVPSTMEDLRGIRLYHVMMRFVAGIALLATIVVIGGTWSDYANLIQAATHGGYRVTSGTIRRFVPEGIQGRPRESFDVDGVHFSYSSNDVTSAYHRTVPRGGQLRSGMQVRIFDVGGRIIRIETGSSVVAPP